MCVPFQGPSKTNNIIRHTHHLLFYRLYSLPLIWVSKLPVELEPAKNLNEKQEQKEQNLKTNWRSEQCVFELQMGAVERAWQPSESRDQEQRAGSPSEAAPGPRAGTATVPQKLGDPREIEVGDCPQNLPYRLLTATLAGFLVGFLPRHDRFLQIRFLEVDLCQANHAKAASFPCVVRVDWGRPCAERFWISARQLEECLTHLNLPGPSTAETYLQDSLGTPQLWMGGLQGSGLCPTSQPPVLVLSPPASLPVLRCSPRFRACKTLPRLPLPTRMLFPALSPWVICAQPQTQLKFHLPAKLPRPFPFAWLDREELTKQLNQLLPVKGLSQEAWELNVSQHLQFFRSYKISKVDVLYFINELKHNIEQIPIIKLINVSAGTVWIFTC